MLLSDELSICRDNFYCSVTLLLSFVLKERKKSTKISICSFDFRAKFHFGIKSNFEIIHASKPKFFQSIKSQQKIRYSHKKEDPPVHSLFHEVLQ